MHVLIPLDEECGLLDPLASLPSASSRPDEELARAADFVTALVKSGACKFYEMEANGWVLEIRFPSSASPQRWTQ